MVRYFKIALIKDNGVRVESYPVVAMATDEGYAVSLFDTDGDGFPDDLEIVYGTDINNGDTDSDGLSDYQEVYIFGLDPTTQDTDGNGVLDGDEDFDGDGMSNLSEAVLQTDPYLADTDGDGIDDGEEENTYYTNPLEADTDGDGADDGKEIELGTNPLIVDKAFVVEFRAEEIGETVVPSVQIQLSGEQIETLSIEPVYNETFFPETMPGYMGRAYDFSVEGEFDSAIISFEFEPLESGPDADPVIYYFNEKLQELEELETTINGNVASVTTTHFSKYILLNRTVYEDAFTWQDVWTSTGYTGAEIVLVIDDSGSLGGDYGYDSVNGVFAGGEDPEHQRLMVARDFVDNANENSKIGIVKFDGVVDDISGGLTECNPAGKEILKNYLQFTYKNSGDYNINGIFDSRGHTYMYGGIEKALNQFSNGSDAVLKVMIVFTDGAAHDTGKHSSVVQAAKNKGVKVYTVGLGTNNYSYFESYLKPLTQNTGGIFYLASDATQLEDIYKDISEKIDIETDSDGDGIPDYYEDNMICFNGVRLKLDKNLPDTDGDGITDGDEVELEYEYSADRKQVKVTCKLLMGNPTKKDTDEDGYPDDEDLNPFIPYKTPIILLHGLNDNTVCFGVNTLIKKKMNTDYGSVYTKVDKETGNQYSYIECESHKILTIDDGRLGAYLTSSLSYSKNKNLFAFNYPNHDMVQFNGLRLSGYISDLIVAAQKDEAKDVVDAEYLFATKDDKLNGNVKFILIGHSMGGLVSRYYIENLGTTHVEKLITIDTPHYGSGLANISDGTGNIIKFSPSIFDLHTESTLFGGKRQKIDFALGGIFRADTKYALNNQSPALKGNHNCAVDYYAIGGYDVGRVSELWQLPSSLRDMVFAFEFDRNVSSKDAYKAHINAWLSVYTYENCGVFSELDLGDADGDNTVDHMSQFAVRFKEKRIDYQELKRTVMVVNSKKGAGVASPFHNSIHKETCMHETVGGFIND